MFSIRVARARYPGEQPPAAPLRRLSGPLGRLGGTNSRIEGGVTLIADPDAPAFSSSGPASPYLVAVSANADVIVSLDLDLLDIAPCRHVLTPSTSCDFQRCLDRF